MELCTKHSHSYFVYPRIIWKLLFCLTSGAGFVHPSSLIVEQDTFDPKRSQNTNNTEWEGKPFLGYELPMCRHLRHVLE